MKKSIIGIVAVVFLVAIIAATAQRYYYTRYGVYYSYPERYGFYYPFYTAPAYVSPSYAYPYSYPYYQSNYYPPYYYSPLSSQVMYRYGAPTTVYPASVGPAEQETPRGVEGQLCGVVDSNQYGCIYGLVCDYTKGAKAGVGVCSRQSGDTTVYPAPSTTYPYYYRYVG